VAIAKIGSSFKSIHYRPMMIYAIDTDSGVIQLGIQASVASQPCSPDCKPQHLTASRQFFSTSSQSAQRSETDSVAFPPNLLVPE